MFVFSCESNIINEKKSYFENIKNEYYNSNNHSFIKRYIFLSDILKKEASPTFRDLYKAETRYHGKIFFVNAPRYLPVSIRNGYKDVAYKFYQLLFSSREYMYEMEDVFFNCFEADAKLIKEVMKMNVGDISFFETYEGYIVFLFEGENKNDYSKYKNNHYQRISSLKYFHKEKQYMNDLYYGKDVVRNYYDLVDTDMKEDVILSSYKGENIYLSDIYNGFVDANIKNEILNTQRFEARVILFEEQVFRPFIEQIHFASMYLDLHPMYNIWLYNLEKEKTNGYLKE